MDDLTRIKGIGKAAAKRLADAGITTFAQLAALAAEQAEALGVRPDWILAAAETVESGSPAVSAAGFVALQDIRIGAETVGPGRELPAGLTEPELKRLVELGAVVPAD